METEAKKILVIGSYNVGLTCQTDRVPVWGETLIGHNFSESNGGKGANQAVAAARLGGDVAFVGCLGNDRYGDEGLRMLEAENIDVSGVRRSNNKSTGVGFIFLNAEGENCILVDPGANHDLLPNDESVLSKVDEADIIVCQLENRIDTVRSALRYAWQSGKTVILNPAPANIEALELLQYTTIINPNESELLILNGENPNEALSIQKCEELAFNLLDKGPEAVIVTRGENGALIVTQQAVVQVPAYKVEAVDTTGAGDSFTGALAVYLAEGLPLKEAVEKSSIVGSYCVTKRDVIPGLPTREKLEEFEKQIVEI
ncbi:ribokinase [Bacillus sp. FJAT-50079]|uniref:ribokinase n=1 Tax=Bacillus sp. FJAT-50079 TaxID=2833577 RepID=UPI001BCA1851|nr:ribokinase [Bacillus sp. FJAT-50079]MBS4206656.1 ribokinase [Bacillus sp. FJAT-50079]